MNAKKSQRIAGVGALVLVLIVVVLFVLQRVNGNIFGWNAIGSSASPEVTSTPALTAVAGQEIPLSSTTGASIEWKSSLATYQVPSDDTWQQRVISDKHWSATTFSQKDSVGILTLKVVPKNDVKVPADAAQVTFIGKAANKSANSEKFFEGDVAYSSSAYLLSVVLGDKALLVEYTLTGPVTDVTEQQKTTATAFFEQFLKDFDQKND